jgi:PAS domain-containing protein
MPAPYPFIDVAVHDSIRPRFARGEALVVFSPALDRVLWANGAGARFFGNASIYDFLEEGPNRGDVTFRQIEGVARQLGAVGDSRSLLLRIASGFQRVPVTASAEMVEIRPGEPVVLLAVPPIGKAGSLTERAADMLTGFDDPDTHMAVLDGEGQVVVASAKFAGLGITPQTARSLVTLAGADADHLVKRPIPTGRGHLPAAIGKLSDDPALHLLFTVETILGHMDPTDSFDTEEPTGPTAPLPAAVAPVAEPAVSPEAAAIVTAGVVEAEAGFAEVVNAIGEIEEFEADEVEALDETYTDETGEDAISAEAVSSEPAAPGDAVLAEAAAEVVETLENEVGPLADTEAADLFPDADETVEAASPQAVSPQAELPLAAEAVPETAADLTPADDAQTDTPVEPAQTEGPLADAELPTPASVVAAESATAPDDAPVTEAAPAEVAVAASAPSGEPPAGAFVFSPERRATRFVWKIDADGRFCDVSHEFAEAVGPHAADINGVAFTDLAALFNLDPEGKIGELLMKRDTWSGKTIHWPVEGTSLMVPVDLAALPTYTRSRDFDGFRGFGIVRLADAIEDPHRTGMTFVGGAAPRQPAEPEISEAAAETVPSFSLLDDEADETNHAEFPGAEAAPGDDSAAELPSGTSEGEAVSDRDMPAADTAAEDETAAAEVEDGLPRIGEPEFFEAPAEPPRSPVAEPPALQIVETPGRRHSDKVVQLEERRARGRDGLTPGEQAAFLEIARKLDPQGLREKAAEALNEIRRNEAAAAEAAAEEAASSAATEQAEADREPAEAPEAPAVPETAAAAPLAPDVAADNAPGPEDSTVGEFATLRLKRDNTLTAEIVDLMPVALLVHVGDRLIHANPEFLALTGYASVEDLDTAGGLDVLIQRQDLEGASEEAGRVVIVRADDQLVPVTARLQSIRFERATALMLALIPAGAAAQAAPEKPAAPHALAAQPVAEPQGQAGAEQLARLQVEVDELRAILETATDGVVILGADGDIRSMNRAASALFNFDEAETRGKPFVMLFAHEAEVDPRLSRRPVRPWRGERAQRRPRSDRPRGLGRFPAAVHDHRQAHLVQRLLRRDPRHHPVEADRGGTAQRQARRRDRQCPQERLPRPRQPRDPHAAQRHHRLCRHDGQRTLRPGRPSALCRICQRHRPLRPARARHRQRPARHFQDRGRRDGSRLHRRRAERDGAGGGVDRPAAGQRPARHHPHRAVAGRAERRRRYALDQADRAQHPGERHPLHAIRWPDHRLDRVRAERQRGAAHPRHRGRHDPHRAGAGDEAVPPGAHGHAQPRRRHRARPAAHQGHGRCQPRHLRHLLGAERRHAGRDHLPLAARAGRLGRRRR